MWILSLFSSVKAIVGIIALLIGIAGIGAAYYQYTTIASQRDALLAQTGQYEVIVAQQRVTIEQAVSTVKAWQEEQRKLSALFQETADIREAADAYRKKLDAIFARYDLNEMARTDAKDLEKRVNRGTANIFRVFECITESPFNTVCRPTETRQGSDSAASSSDQDEGSEVERRDQE